MLGLVAPLAAILGIEVEHLTSRLKGLVVVYLVIGLLSLTGLGFLIAAGYLGLAGLVGPLYAALILGGVFLLLAGGVYLGAMIGEGRRRKAQTERRRTTETGAFLTTAAVTALPVLARSPLIVKLGLPAAAIAALLMMRDGD